MKTKREFTVLIERDEDGVLIASVPALKGCHTQAKTLPVLFERIKEAILLCLEVERPSNLEFVGLQEISV
jgi:predicted RNase H-like HicB family nuclease